MIIQVKFAAGIDTVVVRGRFDVHQIGVFRKTVEPLVAAARGIVRFDLSETTFLDGAACAELVRLDVSARSYGVQIVFSSVSAAVRVILELSASRVDFPTEKSLVSDMIRNSRKYQESGLPGVRVATLTAAEYRSCQYPTPEHAFYAPAHFERRFAPMTDERTASLDSLSITVAHNDDETATVVLAGRLDAVEAPELRRRLAETDLAECRSLNFDLRALTAMDSAGLAVIVKARRECQHRGGDVTLIPPHSDRAMRILRLTQFDQIFTVVAQPS